MKDFLPKSTKGRAVKRMLNEALDILSSVGIPVEAEPLRRRERMAACMMAVAGVSRKWSEAQSATDGRHLKTREVIPFVNKHFEENISSGSYDDVRRKDLKLAVVAGLIVNSGDNPGRATNDPTRGYALDPEFAALIRTYGTPAWTKSLIDFNENRPSLAELLKRKRNLERIPVTLPDGSKLDLSLGEHNKLQKAIIEEYFPRHGHGAEILYVGDTSNKKLLLNAERLAELNFMELAHGDLPDVVAYSAKKNWVYLVEAVHSSGPVTELRVIELLRQLERCTAGLMFVTAFLTREEFGRWSKYIAWETDVWFADEPDHLVHWNGHKLQGPYPRPTS